MTDWVKELKTTCDVNLPIIIVGNKSDLENNRQIPKDKAEEYSRQLGVDHFSASARTGNNVVEVFR
jgi:Ras-related protein Rab-5C